MRRFLPRAPPSWISLPSHCPFARTPLRSNWRSACSLMVFVGNLVDFICVCGPNLDGEERSVREEQRDVLSEWCFVPIAALCVCAYVCVVCCVCDPDLQSATQTTLATLQFSLALSFHQRTDYWRRISRADSIMKPWNIQVRFTSVLGAFSLVENGQKSGQRLECISEETVQFPSGFASLPQRSRVSSENNLSPPFSGSRSLCFTVQQWLWWFVYSAEYRIPCVCCRTPFNRLPRIGGRVVNLYLLYSKVTALGGWKKVGMHAYSHCHSAGLNLPPLCLWRLLVCCWLAASINWVSR